MVRLNFFDLEFGFWNLVFESVSLFFAMLIQKDRGNGPFDVLASYLLFFQRCCAKSHITEIFSCEKISNPSLPGLSG
jgi:hypothetical protein